MQAQERPTWAEAETALWLAATQLDAGNDPALAELREQGLEFLPIADALRRVLVVAHR